MALPLPNGQLFHITHRVLPADYEMPSLEIASDHYSIGYHISGDRTIITPNSIFVQHAGNVSTLAPYIYHRTVPASNEVYENILVKFSPLFVKPLTDQFGEQILDQIYARTTNSFPAHIQATIGSYFTHLLEEYNRKSPYGTFKIQCILCELLLAILEYRLPEENMNSSETPLTPPIMDAVYYMETHYAEALTIEKVAGISNYSVAYFSRLFKNQLGKSYSEYLSHIRIKNVSRLLLNTDKSITEIAIETGYQYPGNLSASFRQKTGVSPQQYRRQQRNLST
ncbi:MAG: helix-turn-helix transcriptional regulator [Lachnospiraceae bacterium]|nr:helix-turn-helix transcriptional regulator [Lachnospiraceae bacterium]